MNIILHGSDASRIQKHLSSLKTKYKIDTPVIHIDASSQPQAELLFEMDSFSIFDEAKMIVVDNCSFLSSKDTTKYDIQALIDRSNIETIVVYCCLSDKLDQRKKLVKELASKSQVIACIALDEKSKTSYVNEICKRIGLDMDYDAMKYFNAIIGLDSIRIENELNKLKLYSNSVTVEDVKALVSVEPLNDVFKMVNALFEKKALRFLAFYRNFRELNMEPIAINGLLSGQIRFLFQVKVLMDERHSKDEIASILKAHPYRIKISMERANLFSYDELLDMLEQLANLDQNIKRGLVDKDEGFEQFALDMLVKNG